MKMWVYNVYDMVDRKESTTDTKILDQRGIYTKSLMNYQVMLLSLSYLCGMRTCQLEEQQPGEALADSRVPTSSNFSTGISDLARENDPFFSSPIVGLTISSALRTGIFWSCCC